jgi:hypothetical protein
MSANETAEELPLPRELDEQEREDLQEQVLQQLRDRGVL